MKKILKRVIATVCCITMFCGMLACGMVKEEENVFPMIPAGATLDDMIYEKH